MLIDKRGILLQIPLPSHSSVFLFYSCQLILNHSEHLYHIRFKSLVKGAVCYFGIAECERENIPFVS